MAKRTKKTPAQKPPAMDVAGLYPPGPLRPPPSLFRRSICSVATTAQERRRRTLTLSTLHSAKGREFGLVFMFGMDNGRLPRNGASQGQIVEARRLFYVGFTRAKSEVHLTHTARRSSLFVDEIEQHLASGV